MEKTINVLELADALAQEALTREWEGREENMFREEHNGDLRFCDDAQEIFNDFYAYYLDIIENM